LDCRFFNFYSSQFKPIKRYTAYTIIEVLVVLAIIAVLSGVGIAGMSLFRRTVQIEQAKNDLLSALRETGNLARNSVSSAVYGTDIITGRVDGYALFIDLEEGNYSLRYCIAGSFVGQLQYDCSGLEKSSAQMISAPEVDLFPADADKCPGIFFARLTGDISALGSDISAPDDVGNCILNLIHTQGGETRQINIDLAGNNISQL
jgi:prepilin-type N-terminal cleavage/methylation domain-containing protein